MKLSSTVIDTALPFARAEDGSAITGAAAAHTPLGEDGAEIVLTVTSPAPVPLGEIGLRLVVPPSFLGNDLEAVRVFKHNYQSWGATYALGLGEADFRASDPINRSWTRSTPAQVPPGEIESDGFLLVCGTGGQHLLIGFLTALRHFGAVVIRREGAQVVVEAYQQTEGRALAAGETFTAEPLAIYQGDDPWTLLENYADEVGQRMGARVPDAAPVGWNPYYFYYCKDTADDFATNARRLTELRPMLPATYLSTDEGPSPNRGDWFAPSERYPGGVAWAVALALDAGFAPGVWWTPFTVSASWGHLCEHADWMLRDAAGVPVPTGIEEHPGQQYLALDASHPEVLDFLRETTRHYVALGARLLKLDFCYAGALQGKRYDAAATRVTALRNALRVIREACGEDVLLLGCGMPVMPAIGLVDCNRIGQDFQPYWDAPNGDKNLFGRDMPHRNILTRGFTHRRWYLNDPDCLSIRQDSTQLTEAEAFCSLHIVGMSGGPIFYSDNLVTLAPERVDWYAFASPPVCWERGPIPLDLLERETPTMMLAQGEDYWTLLLYNDTREPREFNVWLGNHLPADEYVLFEVHQHQVIGEMHAYVSLTLPVEPHSVRYFRLTPRRSHPQVVGDSLHISQGSGVKLRESYQDGELYIELDLPGQRRGAVYVYDSRTGELTSLPVEGNGKRELRYSGL
ncbi:MAG TPA: alpha-galactosidase [Armatimonadota bacterium]